jgi:hypothetical protein
MTFCNWSATRPAPKKRRAAAGILPPRLFTAVGLSLRVLPHWWLDLGRMVVAVQGGAGIKRCLC